MSWLDLTWGWRAALVAGGVLGLLWVAVWAVIYQLPRRHRWLGAEELNLIESGAPSTAASTPVKTIPLRRPLGVLPRAWQNITLPAEVFPSHVVGSVTGIGRAFGGVCGVFSQQAIGWTVQNQSYMTVFFGMMVLYPVAFALVCLLIRQLGHERKFTTWSRHAHARPGMGYFMVADALDGQVAAFRIGDELLGC